MSTRSIIAVQTNSSNVMAVYCHFDGYPSNNGRLLLENYNSAELATKLVSMGGISFLKENMSPKEGQEHNFDSPADNVTCFYHRDRGDEIDISKFDSPADLLNEFKLGWGGTEFCYLFADGKWKIAGAELKTTKGKFDVFTNQSYVNGFYELTNHICRK